MQVPAPRKRKCATPCSVSRPIAKMPAVSIVRSCSGKKCRRIASCPSRKSKLCLVFLRRNEIVLPEFFVFAKFATRSFPKMKVLVYVCICETGTRGVSRFRQVLKVKDDVFECSFNHLSRRCDEDTLVSMFLQRRVSQMP